MEKKKTSTKKRTSAAPTIKDLIGKTPKSKHRSPNPSELAQKMVVLIRFIKAYQKPANAGGRIIKKGREYFVTLERAEFFVKIGVAEAVMQYVPKAQAKKEGAQAKKTDEAQAKKEGAQG